MKCRNKTIQQLLLCTRRFGGLYNHHNERIVRSSDQAQRLTFVGTTKDLVRRLKNAANRVSFSSSRENSMPVGERSPHDCTFLLRLFHNNSKQQFLIETGAEVSVFPAGRSDRLNKGNITLRAANISSIPTYGVKQLTIDFGLPRPLAWRFLIADVTQPIIGADFLLRHKLLVDLNRKRLIDTLNGARVLAEISTDRALQLNNIAMLPSSEDPFTQLLEEFPFLTTPCTSDTPVKHGVSHHII